MTYDLTLGMGALLYGAMDRIMNATDSEGNAITLPFKTKYAFQRNMESLKKYVEDYDRTCLIALAMWGTMNEDTKEVELIGEEAHLMYDAMLCDKAAEAIDVKFLKIPLIEFNRLVDLEVFAHQDEVNVFHVYLVEDPDFLDKVKANMGGSDNVAEDTPLEVNSDTSNI